jgi:alkanesulfonate monooxygenase SsuD/methylene tetrahydromethanopterin reductase-like flavin-dependent oxidoreductase (luciferase family)
VKVHWFHLMPYRWLPADFKDKHRSVWVDIDSRLFDPERGHHMYNEFLDELEYASAAGFDGICVNEHHSNAYGQMPSPNIMAAALSRRTRETALIVLGNSLALYNPPIRVAEEMAMLDVISGGRLVAGMPVGTSMDTNFAYGMVPATLRDRYREAHDLIVKAWTEQDTFSFNGRFTQLRYVNCWPRPIQKPHPPVWIPGGGSIETWDWCVERNYLYAYLSYFGYKRGLKVLDKYWERVEQLGVPKNPYRSGFLQLVCISETDEQAERDYAEHVDYFFNRCLHVYNGFADAPGYRTEATIRAGVLAQVGQYAELLRLDLGWKEFNEQGYVIAGSPETVKQRLEEMVKRMNLGHLMVLLQIGSMPKDLTIQNTQLFAEKVLPHIKPIWEGQWEDNWWIKPLQKKAQPGEALAV